MDRVERAVSRRRRGLAWPGLALRVHETVVVEAAPGNRSGRELAHTEVIHAGLTYARLAQGAAVRSGRNSSSLPAPSTGVGARALGKLVVATWRAAHRPGTLQQRAGANGCGAVVDAGAARRWSPTAHCNRSAASHPAPHRRQPCADAGLQGIWSAPAAPALLSKCTRCNLPDTAARVQVRTADGLFEIDADRVVQCRRTACLRAGGRFEGCRRGMYPGSITPRVLFTLAGRPAVLAPRLSGPVDAWLGVIHARPRRADALRSRLSAGPSPTPGHRLAVDARCRVLQAAIRRYWPALPDAPCSRVQRRAAAITAPARWRRTSASTAPADHGVPGLVNLFGI